MEMPPHHKSGSLYIGWAEVDITPSALPVVILGQFYARLSEGVADPLRATACVLEQGGDHVVFVSCDMVSIFYALRDRVRELLARKSGGPDPTKVIFNATHTHAGADTRAMPPAEGAPAGSPLDKLKIGEVSSADTLEFTAQRLADCITSAWEARAAGGISYGMDYAVVGRNRRWVDSKGVSTMYQLKSEALDRFRHFEGYEDHSVNLLATYDEKGGLVGVIVNIPCPSQEDENAFVLSADFWHEARLELRKRFGENLFILPQVSAAGDLTSHVQYDLAAHSRMLRLRGVSERQEVALKIADAVGRVLPCIGGEIEHSVLLKHQVEQMELPFNRLTQADADSNRESAEAYRRVYESELNAIEAQPELRAQPRWYIKATTAYNRMSWHQRVVERFESQKTAPSAAEEIHFVRLGDVAFASNPFEYYLDFGVQIKVRSPAVQTFLIQLAGGGTYVPSPRSVAGGGYGSVAASNPFGAEAGQILADNTVRALRSFWEEGKAGC